MLTEKPSTPISVEIKSSPKERVFVSTRFERCSSKIPSKIPSELAAALKNLPFRKERPTKCRKFSNLAAKMDSRWPVRRLEQVAEVIVEALKEKRAAKSAKSSGMTRQEARDARVHIGDTGLIDHVLKSMSNVIVGNYVVRRSVNRSTKILEYTIEEHKGSKGFEKVFHSPTFCQSRRRYYFDMPFLYRNVLLEYPDCESLRVASQMILHSKHFVKEFPFRDEDDESLKFICRLVLEDEASYKFTATEYVEVPLYATVGDLKTAVENAFQDTYFVLEKLKVTEIWSSEKQKTKRSFSE